MLEAFTLISAPSTGFPKKVICSHGSFHVIARPVAPFRFLPVSRNSTASLNFGRTYRSTFSAIPAVFVAPQLRPSARAGDTFPEFTSSGQRELRDAIPNLSVSARLLEHLVPARIFHFKRQLPIAAAS